MSEAGRIDLEPPRRVHIIGVGGAGMGAIAEVLHGMGHVVSGSDLAESATIDRLRGLGIDARVGHHADNVATVEVIARSTAIPDSNVEVVAVEERGGCVLRRSDILGEICRLRRTIAIAGTHGKTTTSAMLAFIAVRNDLDPSYIVGGDVAGLGSGAGWGESPWFIVEADESDGTFLELGHAVGVVTNVEADHLAHYGGEAGLRAAFERFVADAEVAIVCADDPGAAAVADRGQRRTYGMVEGSDYRMTDLERAASGTSFFVEHEGRRLGRLRVPMPGLHNARNALGATVAALEMGLEFADIASALATFEGVGRRFDRRGQVAGVTLVDDYAHLPTEVAAALDAATDLQAERIVAVFQPHRYSRTESLWRDFEGAFDAADLLIVTDIYAAGEASRPGVTGRLIVDAVERADRHPEVLYAPNREDLVEFVASRVRPDDVCITLGAGDLVTLADELIDLLAETP